MFGFIKHWLTPHEKNNHRAKLLHNSSLVVILIGIIFVSAVAFAIKSSNPQILGVSYSISEGDLISLTNSQRQQNGLSALSEDSQLDDAARQKAADMFAKNYWAHFAPDGSTSPWTFIRGAGYNYSYAGENLAKGFTDAGSIVTAWMNSTTHRENLLSPNYHDVGFAIVPGTLQGEDTVLVVQMFGTRQTPQVSTVSELSTQSQAEPTIIPSVTPVVKSVAVQVQKQEPTPTSIPTPQKAQQKAVVNSASTSKAISTFALSFFAVILVIDLLIVERKKIPRIVGHNLDHVILILLFLLFVVLKSTGTIQ